MFCNNCGRSVTINDVTCPHCKVRLGDMLSGERFPGNVFTSTQLKLAPDKKGDLSGIVSVENMGSHKNEDNVYSGTGYRAAFTEPAEDEQDTVWMNRGEKQEEDQAEELQEEETASAEEAAEAEAEAEPAEDMPEEEAEEIKEEEDIPQDIPVYEDEQTDDDEEEVDVEADEDEERVFDDEDEDEETGEEADEDEALDEDDEVDPFEEDRAPMTHTKKQISPEFLKTMEEMKANMAVERKPRSMLWGTLPFGKNRAEAPAEPKHARKDAPIEEVFEPEAAEPEEAEEIFEEVSEEISEEVAEEAVEEAVEAEDTEEDIGEADTEEETDEETDETEAEDAEADVSPAKKFLSFFKKKEKANDKAEDKNDVTVDDDLFDAEEELTEEENEEAAETEEDGEEAPDLEELNDDEADETEEKRGFDLKGIAAKIGSSSIVKYIIYAAAGVLIILGIISWLKNVSAQSSNIAGVTHSVYNDAIAKMTAFVRQENVDMLTQTASANESYAKELMEEDREAITGLLPESPMESDEVFLAAVANIHKAAEDVIGKDGAAIYEGKAEERKAASEQEWGIINEAVESLKEANTATQVTSISVNLQNMIMPAPTATPEPVVKTVTYSTLREGMSDDDDVAKLQRRLIKLGYLDGEADGDFGPKTTNAIKSFQNAVGMTADGVAGAELQEKLYAEDAPKAGK